VFTSDILHDPFLSRGFYIEEGEKKRTK